MKKLAILFTLLISSSLSFAQLAGDVNLSSANATFWGENESDIAGHHVSIIGDIDNDGNDDFVITAPKRDFDETTADNGGVYLFYGDASGWSGQISLRSADALFTGALAGQEASHDVFGLGDINNDGYPDFGVGLKKHNTPSDSARGGKVYLFFGSATRLSGEASLETADASLVGTKAYAEAAHVTPAGDTNGDGFDDFIVGAGFHSQIGAEAGKVYLFLGKPTDQWGVDVSMEVAADASYLAEAAYDWAGHRVAGVGDVNDDGKDDFIIGAHNVDTEDLINNGKVYLILGKKNGWQTDVSLSQADASWIGQNKQGLGWNVASPGDVDGDDIPDMLFGQKKGKYFVVLSKNLNLTQEQPIETTADVSFSHAGVLDDDIGHDNGTLGDINADGFDDFIIGGSKADDATVGTATGKSYVFWGRSNWPSSIALDDADVLLTGENAEDAGGFSASGLGDVNNDGINDLLISAIHNDENGANSGKIYLFLNTTPALTLLSPNGGEKYTPGENQNIQWLTDPDVDNVKLEFSENDGDTWSLIADNIADTGSFPWTIPDTSSDSCLVRISDASDGDPMDVSNGLFAISSEPSIRIVSPNGGESFSAGSTIDLEWTSNDVTENLRIELSVDNGVTWDMISADENNDGVLSWLVPDRASTRCIIQIASSPTIDIRDVSDAPFSITGSDYNVHRVEAEDVILSDGYIAEDRYESSNGQVARMTTSASNGTVKYNFALVPGEYQLYVRYSDEIDGACQSVVKIENRTVDEWNWDAAVGSDVNPYRRIGKFTFKYGDEISMWTLRDNGEYARVDYFDFKSTGLPTDYLSVRKPNGGETWDIGSTQTIAWGSFATSGFVNIELSRDNGATWQEIAADVPSNGVGTFVWPVEGPASKQCLVRVTDTDGSPVDISDGVFSIVEAVVPSITVISPNGGETWITGSNQAITWTSENTSGALKIDLSRDSGANWETLAATTPDDGSFGWIVSEPAANTCLVRVADITSAAADTSDNAFTIAKPTITITAPNGGESWDIGTRQNIVWKPEYISGNVKVELSRDSGATWETLSADLAVTPDQAGNAQLSWQVSGPESKTCLVKVSAADGSAEDVSDAVFTITSPPSITVTAPNGGEKPHIGESLNITWTSNKVTSDVKVELSRDNGATFSSLTDATPNDGVLEWIVIGPAASECLIKITSAAGTESDDSDAAFSILEPPQITVTSPNGGEVWTIGGIEKITWTSVSTSGQVRIEMSRDAAAAWDTIIETTDDDGEHDWTVTLPASETCLIKITDVAGPAADQSDAVFIIKNPPEPIITIIQPNGGEDWSIGSQQIIKWFSKDISSSVKIELSRNGGSLWEVLSEDITVNANESGISQFDWTINTPASDDCLIKVTALDGSADDVSDAAFIISEKPAVTVTAPNGGEKWQVGTTQTISWQAINIAKLKIELSINAGKAWTELVAETDNTGEFVWPVTGATSDSALIRVSSLDGAVSDTSDTLFAIVPPPRLSVESPNGGEIVHIEKQFAISWHSINTSGWIDIELTRDNGVTWESVADSTEDNGAFMWTATGPASNTCLVRITDVDGSPSDVSDAHFSIAEEPTITLLTPADGDIWNVGDQQSIQWESVNIGEMIKIELSKDGGTSWDILIESVGNTGSWNWMVTQPISDDCYIRVTDTTSGLSAKNAGAFMIKFPTGVAQIDDEIPTDFALLQNYPNPFNPETRITYQLAERSEVTLQVFNIQGSLIATLVSGTQAAGTYMLTWHGVNDAGDLMPSGVYFYRITADNFAAIKRMTYMK
jgi:hypothetical protein